MSRLRRHAASLVIQRNWRKFLERLRYVGVQSPTAVQEALARQKRRAEARRALEALREKGEHPLICPNQDLEQIEDNLDAMLVHLVRTGDFERLAASGVAAVARPAALRIALFAATRAGTLPAMKILLGAATTALVRAQQRRKAASWHKSEGHDSPIALNESLSVEGYDPEGHEPELEQTSMYSTWDAAALEAVLRWRESAPLCQTLLHAAAQADQPNACMLLRQLGADSGATDGQGHAPWQVAGPLCVELCRISMSEVSELGAVQDLARSCELSSSATGSCDYSEAACLAPQ